MTQRLPFAAPLGTARREKDFQKALDIALRTAPRPRRERGLVAWVKAVLPAPLRPQAPASAATADVYRRDIAWRPVLRVQDFGEAPAIDPRGASVPAVGRPKVLFTRGRRFRLKG